MKRIKEKKQVYVPTFKDVVSFQTIDGKIFLNEQEAVKHEELFIKKKELENKFKTIKIDQDECGLNYDAAISCKLLFIKELNDEVKNDLLCLYKNVCYHFDKINLGWNLFIETSDGSDERYVFILKYDELIKEKEEQLKKLKELIIK